MRGFSSLFRFLELDATEYVLEPWHVDEERVEVGLQNLAESDAGEIALDGLVLKVL